MQNYNSNFKNDIRKRAYVYALQVIRFIESLPQNQICATISNQLLRSSTSVGANIIEAQASGTRKDFINFLNYALKSANESKFWLGPLRDSGQSSTDTVGTLLTETEEIGRILGASIITLRGKRKL